MKEKKWVRQRSHGDVQQERNLIWEHGKMKDVQIHTCKKCEGCFKVSTLG